MKETEQAEKEESSSHAVQCCFLSGLWLTCNTGAFQEVINPKTAFYPFYAMFPCIKNLQGILLGLLAESLASGKNIHEECK